MTTLTVAQEIETARERVTPVFEGLREDMTAHFWEGFGEVAAMYRRARNEETGARDFTFALSGLIADAQGTANNPLYRRGAPVPAEYGIPETDAREVPPMPSREPWAGMPTDGSGRLTAPERVVYGLIGAACVAALVILGFLVSGFGSSPDAAPLPDRIGAAAVVATDTREADRDLIMTGAYWSWEAAAECGRGPVSCDAALARINRESAPYGLHVWEDGSVSPLDN